MLKSYHALVLSRILLPSSYEYLAKTSQNHLCAWSDIGGFNQYIPYHGTPRASPEHVSPCHLCYTSIKLDYNCAGARIHVSCTDRYLHAAISPPEHLKFTQEKEAFLAITLPPAVGQHRLQTVSLHPAVIAMVPYTSKQNAKELPCARTAQHLAPNNAVNLHQNTSNSHKKKRLFWR